MDKLVEILPYLDHPLVLAGFVIFLLFGLYKYLVKRKILHQVDAETNSRIVVTLVRNGFLIAILIILLGFALEFYKETTRQENRQYYGYSNAEIRAMAKEYHLTTTAVEYFLEKLRENKVPPEKLILKLEEIANHKIELEGRVISLRSANLLLSKENESVNVMLSKALVMISLGEFDKAEEYFQNAHQVYAEVKLSEQQNTYNSRTIEDETRMDLNNQDFYKSTVTNDISIQEEENNIALDSYSNELLTEPYQEYSARIDLPRGFSANYVLEAFGTALASVTYTLEHTERGLTMTQSTRPIGITALLTHEIIDVRSDMIISDGDVLLVKYDYMHSDNVKDRNISLTINWKHNNELGMVGKVTGVFKGKKVDIYIDGPVWDPLSIQVPIWIDSNKTLPPHVHGIFMKGEFKHYLFQNHGSEKIKFDGKQFFAIKIAGKETKRNRAMYVWLVPELHNIPARIEQWKDEKLQSTVLLESVTF